MTAHYYDFGPYRVDKMKRLLLREDQTVPLTSKAFDTLLMLVSHSGEVLEKTEMMRQLWPDTFVEENNLTQNVAMLRKALGESRSEHRYIVTIPGRGYSFVHTVKEVCAERDDLAASPGDNGLGLLSGETERVFDAGALIRDTQPSARQEQGSAEDALSPRAQTDGMSPLRTGPRQGRRAFLSGHRALALSILLIAAVATILTYLWLKSRSGQSAGTPVSIAVLPFRQIGNEAGDEYLGTALADALITKLSNIHQITVRPTSAVIKYAGMKDSDALSIGRQLGVDYVLEGSVQRMSEDVRLTVQLNSVHGSEPPWADTFDAKFTDNFAVQDIISARVADKLMLKLTGEEQQRLAKHYTVNSEAYQSYLQGRFFLSKRNEEGLIKAIHYFKEAIAKEPNYALAYAGLADAYSVWGFYQFGTTAPEESFRSAKEAALRAINLDDSLAEAHASLALAKVDVDNDEAGAEREYRRAIELNPNYSTAHHWYSDYLALMGRQTEAMAEIKRALELEQVSLVINATYGERLSEAGRYEEALAQLQKTIGMEERFGPAHYLLGLTYEQMGRYDEAIAELKRARELSGGSPQMLAALGHALATADRKAEAQKTLEELKQLATRRYVSPYDIATVYAGLGDQTRAFEWLQKLGQPQTRRLLKADPRMESLRRDPRFQEKDAS